MSIMTEDSGRAVERVVRILLSDMMSLLKQLQLTFNERYGKWHVKSVCTLIFHAEI